MARTSPRIARVPHTAKRPERCPHCGSTAITRTGTRRKKIEIVQLWRCASCIRVFTPTPSELRNKTYPPRQTVRTIKLYHRQVYKYEYHPPKLAMLRQGRVDADLADFQELVPAGCPRELFVGSVRASQKAADFVAAKAPDPR